MIKHNECSDSEITNSSAYSSDYSISSHMNKLQGKLVYGAFICKILCAYFHLFQFLPTENKQLTDILSNRQ